MRRRAWNTAKSPVELCTSVETGVPEPADECIDCGACVPACPVEAIFALDETPEKWKDFISVNAQHYQK
jgi:NAD-dependent dihydropyrimidine dehydrogenase PreA subunit